MRWLIPAAAVLMIGCSKPTTYIPPAPEYLLFVPSSEAVWVDHVQKGFIAGCEQLRMECRVVKYTSRSDRDLIEQIVSEGDTKGAPVSIVFESSKAIRPVTDGLSLKNRLAITIGSDDAEAYRVGHVGPDAKRLATFVAVRSQKLEPPAKRILYVIGKSPTNASMIDAAAFRESNRWSKYRPRVKTLDEVGESDYEWCDLVVPLGEDALKAAIASKASRVFPTDPTDEAISLLEANRATYLIVNNYFDIGLRSARIAREEAVYGSIADPVLLIPPKEVDKTSLKGYLETRFRVPPIIREKSPPARPGPPPARETSSSN